MDDKRAMDAMTWVLAMGLWLSVSVGLITGLVR